MVYLERFLLSDLKEFLSVGVYGSAEVDLVKGSCLMPLDVPGFLMSTGAGATQASKMRRDIIEGGKEEWGGRELLLGE